MFDGTVKGQEFIFNTNFVLVLKHFFTETETALNVLIKIFESGEQSISLYTDKKDAPGSNRDCN